LDAHDREPHRNELLYDDSKGGELRGQSLNIVGRFATSDLKAGSVQKLQNACSKTPECALFPPRYFQSAGTELPTDLQYTAFLWTLAFFALGFRAYPKGHRSALMAYE
jgi:hypothetical protein